MPADPIYALPQDVLDSAAQLLSNGAGYLVALLVAVSLVGWVVRMIKRAGAG